MTEAAAVDSIVKFARKIKTSASFLHACNHRRGRKERERIIPLLSLQQSSSSLILLLFISLLSSSLEWAEWLQVCTTFFFTIPVSDRGHSPSRRWSGNNYPDQDWSKKLQLAFCVWCVFFTSLPLSMPKCLNVSMPEWNVNVCPLNMRFLCASVYVSSYSIKIENIGPSSCISLLSQFFALSIVWTTQQEGK